ncbi:NACHT domain-containing protein [Nitrospirillum pindoramense]|uniref:Leucine rich repeat (LRR) protein n=1 Tax=Nitrospirillum amazonense TaxID=28077 RepID=A0A560GH23_9PROT|nr:hypothetical protein [Nitrospirillum amazonense]TWB33099.1 leucine rich repeat (LRR) protein [Nitrospirillum amazonense]
MPDLNAPSRTPYFPARLGMLVQRGRFSWEDEHIQPPRYEAWRETFVPGPDAWKELPEAAALQELLRVEDGLTVILGEPGAGKSRLLEHWAEQVRPEAPGYGALGPLLLPLRRLCDLPPRLDRPDPRDPSLRGGGLADVLWALGEPGVPGEGRFFRPLWLLDGLDELPDGQPLADWLMRFHTLPGAVAVTCRTAVWQGGGGELAQRASGAVQTLMPLRSQAERSAYLAPTLGRTEAAILAAALDCHSALTPLAGTPLLLTLAAELWREDKTPLPTSRAAFYRRVVGNLWKRRLPKEGQRYRTRERDRVLERLAATMDLAPEVDMGVLEDCVAAVCRTERDEIMERLRASGLLVVDDRRERVSFLHLTFQEYYLAETLAQKGALAAVRDRWQDPRYREVLALLLTRSQPEETSDAVQWLVKQGEGHKADPSVLHGIGHSPLRTALHLVARSGLSPEALGAGWRALQDAVGTSSCRTLVVASDKQMPPLLLERLAAGPDFDVRRLVSSNPSTPPQALERLAFTPECDVRREVASNPSTPPQALERLAFTPECDVRREVASNPSTPPQALERLATDPDQTTRCRVGCNPSASVEILECLAADLDVLIRSSAAENLSATPQLLERLSADPEGLVRERVACNPSTPLHILERLAADPDSNVWERIFGHPSLTPQLLERLATHPDNIGRSSEARIPLTRVQHLERMATHPDNIGRSIVAGARDAPEEILKRLAADPDESIRNIVASNPSASVEILECLAADPDELIRSSVADNPSASPQLLERLAADPDLNVVWLAANNPSILLEVISNRPQLIVIQGNKS